MSCLRSMTKMKPMPASCKLKRGETFSFSVCWQPTWLPRTSATPPSHAISALQAKVHARERSQQSSRLPKARAAPPCNSQDFLLRKGGQIFSVCCLFLSIHSQISRSPSSWHRETSHCTARAKPLLFWAWTADRTIPNKLQDPYIRLVPASEVPCSDTFKNGS